MSGLIKEASIKKTATSSKGRKCQYPHCKHTLSIYNHDIYCHVHLGQMVTGRQGKARK